MSEAIFNEAIFNEAIFNEAIFNEAIFNEAIFNEAIFNTVVNMIEYVFDAGLDEDAHFRSDPVTLISENKNLDLLNMWYGNPKEFIETEQLKFCKEDLIYVLKNKDQLIETLKKSKRFSELLDKLMEIFDE